jgi:hypothetical protein
MFASRRRKAKMTKLNFVPSKHGFHFDNSFEDDYGLFKTQGLCGGMSLAVFNYFRHDIPIPTHKQGVGDFGTADDMPPAHSRLRDYIYTLQWGSFATAGGFLWPWDFQAMLNDFNRVRNAIDSGQFLLLGLRMGQGQEGFGHQVLAYGYDEGPPHKRIYIYDPNYPDKEILLGLDEARKEFLHEFNSFATADSRFSSYFVQTELNPNVTDIMTDPSRPTYLDLGLQDGIRLSAPVGSDGLRQMGERLEVKAVVRNFGDYPAHMESLLLWARDPQGHNCDLALGQREYVTTIQPGDSVVVRRMLDQFGDRLGSYTFGMAYRSEQGHWIQIPAVAGGTQNKVSVNVVDSSSLAQRWYRVTESLSNITIPAMGVNKDGRLEVFARGSDGRMYHLFQDNTNNSRDWSLSQLPGEPMIGGSPTVVPSNDGRLEVFARGRNGHLWHCWQTRENARADRDWSGWADRGGELASDPAPTRNQDGRLEVFVVFRSGVMHKLFQTTVGSWAFSWFHAMPAPVRFVGSPSAHADQHGRLLVAARGTDHAIWVCQQQIANGPYTGWHSLGGQLSSDPILAPDADGRLEVFALGTNNRVRHCWQNLDLQWTGDWRALDDHLPSGQHQTALAEVKCAAMLNKQDGCLVVAATVAGNRVKTIAQKNPNGGWGNWRDHGGRVESTAALGVNPNGVLEIFARDHLDQLQHTWFPV